MLVYSRYFLGCPWLCLTKAREAKITKGDLSICFIGDIFARGGFFWDVSVESVSAKSTYAGARLSGRSF